MGFWSAFCFSRSLLRILAVAIKSLHVLLFLHQERIMAERLMYQSFATTCQASGEHTFRPTFSQTDVIHPHHQRKALSFNTKWCQLRLLLLFLCLVVRDPAWLVCLCNHKDFKWCSTQNIRFECKIGVYSTLEWWLLKDCRFLIKVDSSCDTLEFM